MIAMSHAFSKTCNYAVLLSILAMAIVTVGANGTLVAADPCIAQLSYPIMPTGYTYSSIQIIVPVSATCPSINNAFTAVGDAYDTSTNTDLGSVTTLLIPVNGGSFSGQLAFSLPPVSLGHTVQISVSVYNGQSAPGQYGTLLTTASETVQLSPANSQNVYYPPNQYLVQQQVTVTSYLPQMIQQPLTGASYFGRQNTNSSFIQQPFARAPYFARQDTSWLVGMVIAVLIAASVIIAVVFAVIGSRNRPLPPPPMLPRKVHL